MRNVFVGSSSEALSHAAKVSDFLDSLPEIRCIRWPQVFALGFLTLEAIETSLASCAGAVLLATPDDRVSTRGSETPAPRANVMFELGLFSTRLGRLITRSRWPDRCRPHET
jgi:CRP/FNR family transcriptional regulator, cyclic AMP receptor protein